MAIFDKLKKQVFEKSANLQQKEISSAKEVKENKTTNKTFESEKTVHIDARKEKQLLSNLKKTRNNAVDYHFALIEISNFYYKYRDNPGCLSKCISYCLEDIALLPNINVCYQKELEREYKSTAIYATASARRDLKKRIQRGWDGNIPAFKRLAIIYEKSGEIDLAIDMCKKALKYGQESDGTKDGFKGRLKKLELKKNT